jgi:predicted deacetylase
MVTVQGRLVVSVHDVSPVWAREVRYLLDALDRVGARPRVLKVIPNEGGSHDIRADAAFIRLLQEEIDAGSEVVLHGFTHTVAGAIQGRGVTAMRAQLFAGPVAEFVTLSEDQMRERLLRGREVLQSVGIRPRGFCAPGWLAAPALSRLLRQCGLDYNVTMLALHDVRSGRRWLTPWRGYMGADSMQERLIRLGGWACASLTPWSVGSKIFLHPQGAMASADCARVIRLIGKLARSHQLVTYGALVG